VTKMQLPTPARDLSKQYSVCVSTLAPAWKPLARQSALPAALQSAAPFSVAAHCSRPETTFCGDTENLGLPAQPKRRQRRAIEIGAAIIRAGQFRCITNSLLRCGVCERRQSSAPTANPARVGKLQIEGARRGNRGPLGKLHKRGVPAKRNARDSPSLGRSVVAG
jgi:hypothetical protein